MTDSPTPALYTAEHYQRVVGVPPALRPWFRRGGRIPLLDEPAEPFTHIPEATVRLVVRHDLSGRRDALVVGPYTRATYKAADIPAACLRLELAPGAVHLLLDTAAADLTDRAIPLSEFRGPLAGSADRLLHATLDEAPALLEMSLPHRIPDDPGLHDRQRLLDAAAAALTAHPVRAVAARLAVSERHLRNLFSTGIGVSPKHFARIGRVRRLLAAAGRTELAEIATTAGYYDQSHMTGDFRALMGVSPARFLAGRLPAPVSCTTMAGPARGNAAEFAVHNDRSWRVPVSVV